MAVRQEEESGSSSGWSCRGHMQHTGPVSSESRDDFLRLNHKERPIKDDDCGFLFLYVFLWVYIRTGYIEHTSKHWSHESVLLSRLDFALRRSCGQEGGWC